MSDDTFKGKPDDSYVTVSDLNAALRGLKDEIGDRLAVVDEKIDNKFAVMDEKIDGRFAVMEDRLEQDWRPWTIVSTLWKKRW